MIPPDIKKRLDRLFGGQRKVEDLSHVFSWLRFHTGGQAPFVRDIGDFIAHRHERNQGFAWRAGLDFGALSTYAMLNFQNADAITIDILKDACGACLRMMSAAHLKSKTGLTVTKATKTLDAAFAKMSGIANRQLVLTAPLTEKENNLVNICSSMIVGIPAAKQNSLCDQIILCLNRNGYVANKSLLMDDLGDFISKFVICLMHGSWLVRPDGAKLYQLTLGQFDGLALVSLNCTISGQTFTSSVYMSNLDFELNLSERLLKSTANLGDLHLEISDQGLIDLID